MEIYWKRSSLRKKIESLAASDREVAKRLIDIKAAGCLKDLMPQCKGRAHFLRRSMKDYFAIDVCRKGNSKRYICSPQGNCEKDSSGNYIRESITELLIEKIENDYH